jgi:hypothetical protein
LLDGSRARPVRMVNARPAMFATLHGEIHFLERVAI